MDKLNQIIYRLRKSPAAIIPKLRRFIKTKIILNYIGRRLEKYPLSITKTELINSLGTLNLNQSINTQGLFNTNCIQDKNIIEEANHLLKREFTLFNQTYKLPELDWSKDYNSGRVWPKKHFSRLDYENLYDGSDAKFPWELNRFHHFLNLGLAYNLNKNKDYYLEFKSQLISWIKENPYQIGINWIMPMECSIRAINFIQAYYLFQDIIESDLQESLLKTLYLHGKHIQENIEWSPEKENHYLTDITGLFFLGLFFKNTNKGTQWLKFAKTELEKEILHQVSKDGVHFEASLNYHRLATELFLISYILGGKNNIEFSTEYKTRLEKMLEFIMYYTTPKGLTPGIGDTDNGRIIDLWNKNINDHRDLLAIGSVIFNRSDFKSQGFWHQKLELLINKTRYNLILSKLPYLESKFFTDYIIIRDNNFHIIVRYGTIGRNNLGGHAHNDQLSFTLSTKTQDYIIDPGTGVYTGNIKLRHKLRSTQSHNTLIVNNQEQNLIKENQPFIMDHRTHTKISDFKFTSDKIVVELTHQGYYPIITTRKIEYFKKEKKIIITDKTSNHANLELNLHINKEIKIKPRGNNIILNNELYLELADFELIQGIISESYNHTDNSQVLKIKKYGNELITKIKFLR